MANNVAKIKVKNLSDLLDDKEVITIQDLEDNVKNEITTPKKTKIRRPSRATTASRINKLKNEPKTTERNTERDTETKNRGRSTKKEPPPSQIRIDTFFKSASKTYQIPAVSEQNSLIKTSGKENNRYSSAKKTIKAKGRKRLFIDEDKSTTDVDSLDSADYFQPAKVKQPKKITPKKQKKPEKRKAIREQVPTVVIDLCLDTDEEMNMEKIETVTPAKDLTNKDIENTPLEAVVTPMVTIPSTSALIKRRSNAKNRKISFSSVESTPIICKSKRKAKTNKNSLEPTTIAEEISDKILSEASNIQLSKPKRRTIANVATPVNSNSSAKTSLESFSTTRKRKPKPCPSYKVVAGTTFAVDAFQFGEIEGVTHYFLSHYHADHYIGLTRKFSMPLYASPITANLIRAFIPIDEQYLLELELNKPQIINEIEVTAIDANHCPGAVMFIFKLPNGKCILHTGDFRASPEMESEPIFWNNDIDTIYLDTTYISDKYAFCTQFESIDKGIEMVLQFREKHAGKRILYVCGSYVIGKEKFWHAIAQEFGFTKVWTEANRRKALKAMNLPEFQTLLCDNPYEADMHIIAMGKLNYNTLLEYFDAFRNEFDLLLAIRPSGWEKNSKPQYRGQINLIGIEYSEHSSHNEMQRFVMYLKPRDVISTVPFGHNLMNCPKVPQKWYKYDKLTGNQKNFQTSITSFLTLSAKKIEANSRGKNELKTPFKSKPLVEGQLVNEKISPQKSTPMALVGTPPILSDAVDETTLSDAADDDSDLILNFVKHSSSELKTKLKTIFELMPVTEMDSKENYKEIVAPSVPVVIDTDDDWLS